MKKAFILVLMLTCLIGCKSKTDPYNDEVQFLKGCYKEGKINKVQYNRLRSRAKDKWR